MVLAGARDILFWMYAHLSDNQRLVERLSDRLEREREKERAINARSVT